MKMNKSFSGKIFLKFLLFEFSKEKEALEALRNDTLAKLRSIMLSTINREDTKLLQSRSVKKN